MDLNTPVLVSGTGGDDTILQLKLDQMGFERDATVLWDSQMEVRAPDAGVVFSVAKSVLMGVAGQNWLEHLRDTFLEEQNLGRFEDLPDAEFDSILKDHLTSEPGPNREFTWSGIVPGFVGYEFCVTISAPDEMRAAGALGAFRRLERDGSMSLASIAVDHGATAEAFEELPLYA